MPNAASTASSHAIAATSAFCTRRSVEANSSPEPVSTHVHARSAQPHDSADATNSGGSHGDAHSGTAGMLARNNPV